MFFKFGNYKYLSKTLFEGLLYFRSLEYFIDYEKTHGKGIGDINEGVIAEGVNVYISRKIMTSPTDGTLISNVKLYGKSVLKNPVFCMSYNHFKKENNKFLFESFDKKVKDEFLNHKENNAVLVIVNPTIFLLKLDRELKKNGLICKGGKVEYKNINEFPKNVEFLFDNVGFTKTKDFEHQKEYRIIIYDKKIEKDNHFELKIGGLTDIAFIMKEPYKMFNDVSNSFIL